MMAAAVVQQNHVRDVAQIDIPRHIRSIQDRTAELKRRNGGISRPPKRHNLIRPSTLRLGRAVAKPADQDRPLPTIEYIPAAQIPRRLDEPSRKSKRSSAGTTQQPSTENRNSTRLEAPSTTIRTPQSGSSHDGVGRRSAAARATNAIESPTRTSVAPVIPRNPVFAAEVVNSTSANRILNLLYGVNPNSPRPPGPPPARSADTKQHTDFNRPRTSVQEAKRLAQKKVCVVKPQFKPLSSVPNSQESQKRGDDDEEYVEALESGSC